MRGVPGRGRPGDCLGPRLDGAIKFCQSDAAARQMRKIGKPKIQPSRTWMTANASCSTAITGLESVSVNVVVFISSDSVDNLKSTNALEFATTNFGKFLATRRGAFYLLADFRPML